MTSAQESVVEKEILSEEDRKDLKNNLREFLKEFASDAELRNHIKQESGYDRALWKRMAEEIGVQGLSLPDEFGGAGFGLSELQLVQEELGRTLYSGPYFSTIVLSASLLKHADQGVQEKYLTEIISGDLTVSLAYREQISTLDVTALQTTAVNNDGSWFVTGKKLFVIDAQGADVFLVPAVSEGKLGIFAVKSEDLQVEKINSFDSTRVLGHLEFNQSPAELIIDFDSSTEALAAVLLQAGVLLGAEQVGASQKVLENTVQYTSERYQFGRPIGSFQAVKHHAANMLLQVEQAKALLDAAVEQLQNEKQDVVGLEEAAAALATESFVKIAETGLQLHGGMGATWEHSSHLFLKRAKANEVLLQTPRTRRNTIASLKSL